MKNRQLTILKCFLVGTLTFGLTTSWYSEKAIATPNFQIYPLGWNVIGLDSNKVTDGPNQSMVGARVCNTGTTAATNVTATFVREGSINSFISLANNISTVTIPSLSAGSTAVAPGNTSTTITSNCYDFYFNTLVTRDSNAYNTTQQFHIDVTATGGMLARTPANRELFVEKLISQGRNSVNSVAGPTTVYAGDTVQYTVTGSTAPSGYEQLVFLPVLPVFFQLLKVSSNYSAPIGAINNSIYADGCGWENNYTSLNYHNNGTCIGPAGYSGGKVGGNTISTTYTIKILGTGSGSLGNIIYDFSGSSYHYNADFGTPITAFNVNAIPASADVVTTIAGPTSATAGSTVTYNIIAINNGPSYAGNVVVTDNIGKNLTNVVASNGGIYDTITGFITFPTISYFANSASQAYTVSFTAPPFGSVTNIVSNTSDTSDPTIANNNGTATNAKVVTVIPTKIVLVKRVTAINGNRAKNPNDGKVLGGFVDDNSSTDDNALGWPSNYLLGELNGGQVNPRDEIEYTVYFLNVGGASITSFRVCDLITGQQNFRADAYGVNQDIEMKIGKLANSSTFFTRFSGDDRAQVIGSTGTVPAGCNLQGVNTNATVVVDVTGSSVPVLPTLPPSNGTGSPDNSFGFFRFVTKVKP